MSANQLVPSDQTSAISPAVALFFTNNISFFTATTLAPSSSPWPATWPMIKAESATPFEVEIIFIVAVSLFATDGALKINSSNNV